MLEIKSKNLKKAGGFVLGKKVKLVVWDLDNTIWQGIISEDNEVQLREGIISLIEELDQRGILQSIASKNNFDQAMEQLRKFQLEDYFIYPMINWNSKSDNIELIVKNINISMDSVAFVDDQQFERDEVNFRFPEVTCINSEDIDTLLDRDDMNPLFITDDSRLRRSMYQSDIKRKQVEDNFTGTQEEFLHSLGMRMVIEYAKEEDLKRAEELTVRTHQLNSTGYTYSYDELKEFITDEKYKLLIVDLNDKYGYYGKIGLVLISCEDDIWTLKLLLTSCRVMSRGVGKALLGLLVNMAMENNKKLRAEYVPTDRNRIMGITYSLMGFHICQEDSEKQTLEYTGDKLIPIPSYLDVLMKTEVSVG